MTKNTTQPYTEYAKSFVRRTCLIWSIVAIIHCVAELLPKVVKEYKLDGDRSADQEFLLRFADQEKAWPMDKVSNAPFTEVICAVADW